MICKISLKASESPEGTHGAGWVGGGRSHAVHTYVFLGCKYFVPPNLGVQQEGLTRVTAPQSLTGIEAKPTRHGLSDLPT